MAYQIHSRVVWRGALGANEEWSTSCAFSSVNTPTQQGIQDLADEALSLMTTWVEIATGSGGYWSTAITLERVDAYAIDTSGNAFGQAEAVATATVDGIATPVRSPQDAVVASLRTGFPGRRFRGRMYLPLLGVPLGADLRMTTSVRNLIGGRMQILLDGMNLVENQTSEPFTACVASGVGSGMNTAIDSVVIGLAIDTQRRRRNNIPESPASFAIA